MKNKYINLNRIEFLVTNKCSSKCIHCSVKNNTSENNVIDLDNAKDILDLVTKEYEPLAKNAKDIAATAVMFCIILHICIWVLVLIWA